MYSKVGALEERANNLVVFDRLSNVLDSLESKERANGSRFFIAIRANGKKDGGAQFSEVVLILVGKDNQDNHRELLSSIRSSVPEGFRTALAGYFFIAQSLKDLCVILRNVGAVFDISGDIFSPREDNSQLQKVVQIKLLERNQSRLILIQYNDNFFALWFSATSLSAMGFNQVDEIQKFFTGLEELLMQGDLFNINFIKLN